MSRVKICRICLSTDVKMYDYDQFQLKSFYEQIMATKVNDKAGLPKYFCYQCAALLHKFHKFKEKCYIGQKALKEIIWNGPLTKKSVRNIDRESKNLHTPISIITINKRVKTCVVKTSAKLKLSERVPLEVDVGSLSDDGDFGDDNYEDSKEHLVEEIDIEKIDIKENKEDNIELEKIEKDKPFEIDLEEKIPTEKIFEIDKGFSDDDMPSDNEKVFVDDIKIITEDEEEFEVKEPVKKKRTRNGGNSKKKKAKETIPKEKKFAVKTTKKAEMDPNNWLKINLTEEEADAEFKARGQHKRYLNAQYKCTDCLKGFSKEDMLKRHTKLRHSESNGPIECRFCHMRFKWKCFLNKHMRQHYTKYKCLRCDLVCPLETTALFHEEYHNGVTRKCDHCGEEFKHLTTYYTHLRTHRSEHVCTLCGASFVSVTGLGIHKKIKHVNADSELPQGEEQYCQRCDVKFETRKAYEEHLIHSAMHVDGIEKRRQNLKRLTRIPTDCHICGKHFATQAACRKHHLAEHPRTSFFAPNERHICEICGMSLAPGSVSSHLNTHTREKLYTCNTCGRQFSSKGGMTTHQLTHTSEKPVACTLCDKRFKQVSSMKLHYRTFHLKEPYPKRNRKKKTDELSKDEYGHEDSDDNMTLDNFYARKY
ncbi:zinc finger protein 260-like isoform X2 [Helicoverpa zea]|uniref:zinc finger protein 260-like isoform X2 n=1 Tax=Helicoverpa zea TaxID=7113 RepID=UPI001F58236E|nr:zinc finger protein 260-like isoform X2 [Helicoverpa zea]